MAHFAIMPRALHSHFSSRWLTALYYALSLCVMISVMIFASSRSKPVEETITIDSNRAKPLPEASIPIPSELPVADPDIETAGDDLAAAVIYLRRRQNQPALNAL